MLKKHINTYSDFKEEIKVQVKNLDVSIEGIGSVLQANTIKNEKVVERLTTLEKQHVLLDERQTALEQRESHTEDKLHELQTMFVKTDPTEGKPSLYFISVYFCLSRNCLNFLTNL